MPAIHPTAKGRNLPSITLKERGATDPEKIDGFISVQNGRIVLDVFDSSKWPAYQQDNSVDPWWFSETYGKSKKGAKEATEELHALGWTNWEVKV